MLYLFLISLSYLDVVELSISPCGDAPALTAGLGLSLQVTVTMDAVKGLCTAEATEKSVQLKLLVKGNSATPAYFSVVPLIVGEIPITISAFDQTSGYGDSIRKNLKVVVSRAS